MLPYRRVGDPSTYGHVNSAGPVRWTGQHYLEVISKVVPKIWARTNSAMMKTMYGLSTKGEAKDGERSSVAHYNADVLGGGKGLQ